MPKSILFQYTISDQSFCMLPGEVVIILSDATIHGWTTKRIWSDRLRGYVDEYVFLITYLGIEYGSLDFDDNILVQGICSDTGFFIFDIEFEEIFE